MVRPTGLTIMPAQPPSRQTTPSEGFQELAPAKAGGCALGGALGREADRRGQSPLEGLRGQSPCLPPLTPIALNQSFTFVAHFVRMQCALCLLMLLGGCAVDPTVLTGVAVGVTAGSVMVIQRTPFDALWSLATGRDCSAVRLDEGKSYCRPIEPAPMAQPYCTRSLGVADCWADPTGHPPPLGDGPSTLTPAQEADRTRSWPF